MTPSTWAEQRLGSQSARIQHEVCLAIRDAHLDAVRAQLAQSSKSRDAFGHTLAVAQHEMLNERLATIPGVVLRRPAGVRSRFEYPVIEETRVVLVPLRFSSDGRKQRNDCRIDLSELRTALLGTAPMRPEAQRSIFEIEDPDAADRADAEYAEEVAAFEEMSKAGRAVVIGFGATPDRLFGFGWGELSIEDPATGQVSWPHWEDLPIIGADAQSPPAPPLRAVPEPDPVDRFDADPTHLNQDDTSNVESDDLGLVLRPRVEPSPNSEKETPLPPTASEDDTE
jgi:hypothetical protein